MERNISEPLPKNYRVGNYVVDKIIGKGGIGSVYLAHHYLLHYKAAIKVHEYLPDDELISNAFLESANYLSQLHHPNIIQLLDYGFVDDRSYMAMEYMDGTTLFDQIPNNQNKDWTARIIQLSVQLLSAVRYSHNIMLVKHDGRQKRGVIHGDIKPNNIFLSKNDGSLKLSDFLIPQVQWILQGKESEDSDFDVLFEEAPGLLNENSYSKYIESLKDMNSDPKITRLFGTPEYMPPEQWEGTLTEVSDIFTIGATLYQSVTGLPPKSFFKGITPRKVNPFLPKWFEYVISRAMEKNPEDRFQSASEIEAVFLESMYHSPLSNNVISELVLGDKVDISMGDLNNQEGQVFIGKFNQVVVELNASGKNNQAEAIKTLKEAIMSSKYLTQEDKKEYIEVVNQIGEEVIKPKQNKTLLKTLGKGLLVALQTVPDLIKAIAALETFIPK